MEVIAVIDTNVFIGVINKEKNSIQSKTILDWIDGGIVKGVVSTVVLAELCSGYENSKEKDEFLAHVLGSPNYQIVGVTVPVALEGARLRLEREIKLPDALILASGLKSKATFLVTNDDNLRKVNLDNLKILNVAEFVKTIEGMLSKESE